MDLISWFVSHLSLLAPPCSAQGGRKLTAVVLRHWWWLSPPVAGCCRFPLLVYLKKMSPSTTVSYIQADSMWLIDNNNRSNKAFHCRWYVYRRVLNPNSVITQQEEQSATLSNFLAKTKGVFSWWKRLGFSTVAYFVVTWQIMPNYGLIRLKRFISC